MTTPNPTPEEQLLREIFTDPGDEHVAAEAVIRAARLRGALANVPELAEHLRTVALHSDGRTEGGELREWRSPLITSVVDALDELYAVLLEWVGYWSETLSIEAPSTAHVAWRTSGGIRRSSADAIAGMPASTTAKGASALTWTLSFWLLTHDPRITQHETAAAYQDEVTHLVWALRTGAQLTAAPVRSVRPRLCPVDCWYDPQTLRAELDAIGVSDETWAEHRGDLLWRWQYLPHHFTVHGEFFGGSIDAAVLRGDDPLDALAGVSVRCSNCGWSATASATQLAKWLS